jgi:potassium channel subfamily K
MSGGGTVPAEVSRPTESSPLQGQQRKERVKGALRKARNNSLSFIKAVRIAVPLLIAFLLLSTVAFMYLEGLSGRDAFYFCMVLLTTVGYGDISPVTPAGKIFTMLYILAALTLAATSVGVIVDAATEATNAGSKAYQLPSVRAHLMGLLRALAMLALMNVLGACWYMVVEGASALDGFYWALVTSTTVGLGDLDVSGPTRTFNCVYLLIAVGAVAYALGELVSVVTTYGQIKRIAHFCEQGVSADLIEEIDVDKSGEVDRFEFCTYMLVNMGKLNQSDVDDVMGLFRAYDLDGSGHINCKDVDLANQRSQA